MNEPGPVGDTGQRLPRRAFISYATADRKQALKVCDALERRGVECWISARDVAPGENYQEAIVRALRGASAVVLVFSDAANDSDEIKKELSLASRYRIPVMALRIEDVQPSDAFAYELSTRQWIDAFEGRDHAIDLLVSRFAQISGTDAVAPTAARPVAGRTWFSTRRRTAIAAAFALLLLAMAAGAWWRIRPSQTAHSMMVRLTGFQLLSSDLPPRLHDTVNAEVIAAFNADGVIGVSTATAPPPGIAPAYALDGTIRRVGDTVRVITRFTNERTGAILWSDSVDYPAAQVAKIPHNIAVDAGTVIRCGLFGASTYRKTLPDGVLSNYMQYCQQYWAFGGSKTLRFAQLVVAAVPDFSWGWSAVANGFMQASYQEEADSRAEEMRAEGRRAEDKAIALDRSNSEALAHKAYLIDPHDWVSQETLFKSAIAAKPLDCGCEHYGYGLLLQKVGRLDDATEQFRQATDMLALWADSEFALADVLVAKGKADEAKPHFDAAIDLTRDADVDKWVPLTRGIETGDYAAAISALGDPQLQLPDDSRAAVLAGYRALASGAPQARVKAVAALMALSKEKQSDTVATMLAALGAGHEALAIASQRPWLFWRRSMHAVLSDPGFPAVARQLGLMSYWKTTHTRPDVCATRDSPAFCRMI